MAGPLIAIVGDVSPTRVFVPPMKDPIRAKTAAQELGFELARRGARLLVYGGPYVEADAVKGFVCAKPSTDHSILMWYSKDYEPPPFLEEVECPNLFERRSEKGADWEVAFYRSISRADGLILIGGGNATKIAGQIAIGTRMPMLALAEFGGGAAAVWSTVSAGEDLRAREEINLMARPWFTGAAAECVSALFAQKSRRLAGDTPSSVFSILAALLFLPALAIVPWIWGQNSLSVWMLFFAPLLAGGAGAAIRPLVDRIRRGEAAASTVLATVVLGLVAGGIASVLFVTAQLTADPTVTDGIKVIPYAQRSIPFAIGVGFVAGLTSDVVFGKLLALDVSRTSGLNVAQP